EGAGDQAGEVFRRGPAERGEKVVGSWPGRWDTARAEALGLKGETSLADVIRSQLADERH
ncbi:NAD-dependent epimerase, partial [Burkholderia cepacia]